MLRIARCSLRQIRDFGFVAIFVAVTSGCTPSLSNPAAGQNQAPTLDRPPARTVGDTFTRKWDGQIVVVTYIGQKDGLNCYSDKAADGRQSEECFDSDDNLVRGVRTWQPLAFSAPIDGEVKLVPSSERLSFPLFVGKHWDASYTLPNSTFIDQHGALYSATSISASVASYEKVTVPAGTFDAFKIVAYLSPEKATGGEGGDLTCYYAPQLGIIKDNEAYGYLRRRDVGGWDYPHTFELISYNLAKAGS